VLAAACAIKGFAHKAVSGEDIDVRRGGGGDQHIGEVGATGIAFMVERAESHDSGKDIEKR